MIVVAGVFSSIELWSNLWHDPFLPNLKEHGWTILRFNVYGAAFLAATAFLISFGVLSLAGHPTTTASRRMKLAMALAGSVFYMLLHHSKHVLAYWEVGGSW